MVRAENLVKIETFRNKTEATCKKAQNYDCLNKAYAVTIPDDMPQQMGRNLWGPTSR